MNSAIARVCVLLAASAFISANVGCRALPWQANKPAETITAEQCAQQAVDEISYDNSVDFSQDYEPSVDPASSYVSPAKSYSAASSSSSGSCCSH